MFGRACRFSGQICNYKGLEYSSPTLASAIGNLSPAFTFILAVIFRFSLPNSHQQSHSGHFEYVAIVSLNYYNFNFNFFKKINFSFFVLFLCCVQAPLVCFFTSNSHWYIRVVLRKKKGTIIVKSLFL